MRVAFLIRRDNHYRLLGPVIDRALARGWDVECWKAADEGFKGDRALERRDAGPAFRSGRPCLREFGVDGLARLVADTSPDVAITLYRAPGIAREGRVRWLALQYTLNIGDLVDGDGTTPFDAIGVHSEHWRTLAADSLRMLDETRGRAPGPVDDRAVAATLRHRGVVVGFPEMDGFHLTDAAAVRATLGLEATRPVVLYCPFPFLSNPRTFWTRNIYGPFQANPYTAKIAHRMHRADRLIDRAGRLRQRLAVRLPAGRRYARDVANGWDDRGVVQAVRAFCDANGAALIVKARAKDPVASYLRTVADHVRYDSTDYPATILELMSIASLCVHFFSTVAYEAAYAGVPSVCVTADADDLGFSPTLRASFLSTASGSSFNFPGVTYPVSVAALVADLPRRRLGDFPLEPAARAQYLEKFVGRDDGKASDRLLDVAASLVEGEGAVR
ncbi:MAG: hypothetical protein E6K82_16045 [Candidatus Rokuibacteriota bacterium]|nr:MAG: hypothetical protein E6K82_16045 [Candidatus Rokubacteria bacterium]